MCDSIYKYRKEKNNLLHSYFNDSKEEISKTNIRIFMMLSIVTCVAIISFMCISWLSLENWHASVYHYTFLLSSIIFIGIAIHINRHRIKTSAIETAIGSVFLLYVMLFLCVLDTIPFPNDGEIFTSIFIVVAPILFIIPQGLMFFRQIFYFAIFCFMAFHFKDSLIAEKDILGVFIGFIMSFAVYGIVMNVRLEEYRQKTVYKHQSEMDQLTGIPNRAFAAERINQYLQENTSEDECAFMVMDIDDFKVINDSFGHVTGDKVLASIGSILRDIFNDIGIVGRIGGDEFIAFIPKLATLKPIDEISISIEKKINEILQNSFNVSCSIGWSVLDSGHASMEEMFKVADYALYETKAYNKGKYGIRHIEK